MEESPGRQEGEHSIARQALIYGALAVITLASVILLILIWRNNPNHDTLQYEAGKTCLQVLGVALVGFVVSFATFTLQRNRERREHESDWARESLQRQAEHSAENLQRRTEHAREDWQRRVEQARDAWRRKDELL